MYRVGQSITDTSRRFINTLVDGQVGHTVCNDNAVVLVLYRLGVVRSQGGKVLNRRIVGIFVDGRHKGNRAAGIRLNAADVYRQQAGIFIIGEITRAAAVQHDRAVLERQASRDNISNGRIFYGYSRGLAVRERQNIGDLVADLGRGLVRRLLNAGAGFTVTDGNTVVCALGVRNIATGHDRSVVNCFAVGRFIDGRCKSNRRFCIRCNSVQRHGQGTGLVIE